MSEKHSGSLGVGVVWGRWEDSCPQCSQKNIKSYHQITNGLTHVSRKEQPYSLKEKRATNNNILIGVVRRRMLAPSWPLSV